jgi:hypothetical protein
MGHYSPCLHNWNLNLLFSWLISSPRGNYLMSYSSNVDTMPQPALSKIYLPNNLKRIPSSSSDVDLYFLSDYPYIRSDYSR